MSTAKYVSKGYKNYKMLMNPTSEVLVTDSQTGRQTKFTEPARYIVFDGFEYSTSDPAEIKFLDEHPSRIGKTKSGKTAKVHYEKAAEADPVQAEFIALVNQFGHANVIDILKKQGEKRVQEVATDDPDEAEEEPEVEEEDEDEETAARLRRKQVKEARALKLAKERKAALKAKKRKQA